MRVFNLMFHVPHEFGEHLGTYSDLAVAQAWADYHRINRPFPEAWATDWTEHPNGSGGHRWERETALTYYEITSESVVYEPPTEVIPPAPVKKAR